MRFEAAVLWAALAAPGCVGLDFSRDTVASAPVQWEYFTLRPDQRTVSLASTATPQADPDLARLGAEGWELVAVNDGAYVFKRPKKP